jgi:hypothetical protein
MAHLGELTRSDPLRARLSGANTRTRAFPPVGKSGPPVGKSGSIPALFSGTILEPEDFPPVGKSKGSLRHTPQQLSWILVSYRGKMSLVPRRDEFCVSVIDGYNLYVVPGRRIVYSLYHRLRGGGGGER